VGAIHCITAVEIHDHGVPTVRKHPSLSPCLELREFELGTPAVTLREPELVCISTIISTKIEKIIIRRCPNYPCSWEAASWTRLDEILIGLVERPGRCTETKLEVEFRYSDPDMELGDEEVYLPKFIERGLVTIWSRHGEVVYCSDAVQH
jgi:hypothetical protein